VKNSGKVSADKVCELFRTAVTGDHTLVGRILSPLWRL
jgi:hypothetical protein